MMMLSAAGCYYGSGMGYGSYANANKIKTTGKAISAILLPELPMQESINTNNKSVIPEI